MGKIVLTIEGTTVGTVANGGGIVIEKIVSEQDSGRLVAAYASTYAGTWKNEDGTLRNPTIAEVIGKWFDGVIAGSVAHVKSVEEHQAAQAAAASVLPITVAAA